MEPTLSMTQSLPHEILWKPSPQHLENCVLSRFVGGSALQKKVRLGDAASLHQFCLAEPEVFWGEWVKWNQFPGQWSGPVLENPGAMQEARWFPQARLNYADCVLHKLKQTPSRPVVHFWAEDQVQRTMTCAELLAEVLRCASALQGLGIQKGDRVAAVLPNCPQALVAMLATVSLGAVWSSASPDFGVQGVLDRLAQIEPKVIFLTDFYWYNGKKIACAEKNQGVVKGLPSLVAGTVVNLRDEAPDLSQLELSQKFSWTDFLQFGPAQSRLEYCQVEFAHPLMILFSSGTTGVPKCIVHGHGGTLVQHTKEHQLHCDLQEGDRLFYFTTLGWMMWNWLVTGLASGAELLLYDGSPAAAGGELLFAMAEKHRCTHFGTSAKFIESLMKQGLVPKTKYPMPDLRMVMSTGSPLSAEGFSYVCQEFKPGVQLASISGGTDIVSCFVLGHPWLPVRRGEIQAAGLGMSVEVWSEDGKVQAPLTKGELVCTQPFPSQPVGFWRDPKREKFQQAYFSRYPGVWCHGDYLYQTEAGGYVILGRSDAVLNPGGVRIGTAEIYRQVEKVNEVLESIVIGQNWHNDVRVVLFVKLREGIALDTVLVEKIRHTIRANTTPRHVPQVILSVPEIPRTKSGKIVELAVRQVVHGEVVKNQEALANPEALAYFRDRSELK